VGERLVSYADAFYSLLAPEGKERNGFTACVFALHNSITLFKRRYDQEKTMPENQDCAIRRAGISCSYEK
jgi:hypothetical protein